MLIFRLTKILIYISTLVLTYADIKVKKEKHDFYKTKITSKEPIIKYIENINTNVKKDTDDNIKNTKEYVKENQDDDIKDTKEDVKEDIREDIKEKVDNSISKIIKELTNSNKNRNNIFIGYIDLGLRIPYWFTKGVLELLNPFTNMKCFDLETFNENTDNFCDALYLKKISEINKYSFAKNYGLTAHLDDIEKKERHEENNINTVYKIAKNFIPNDSIDDKTKPESKNILKTFTNGTLDNLIRILCESDNTFPKVFKTCEFIAKNFKDNRAISLSKKDGLLLSPFAAINVVRFFFIKNATNSYVNKRTEKDLNNYLSNHKDTTIDDLINKLSIIEDEVSYFYYIPIKEAYKTLIKDSIGKENKDKLENAFKEIEKLTAGNENADKKKDFENFIGSKFSESSKTLNDVFERLRKNNEYDLCNLFNDQFIIIKDIIDQNITKIYKNIDNIDEFIKGLIEAKLLPENDETNEDKKINNTLKDVSVLCSKLKKLKIEREQIAILKKLKKEDMENIIPFNYKIGFNFTHYFNNYIGINIDISGSYSKSGFNKTLFMPDDFLGGYFYYLYKLHEPILDGKILEDKDYKVDDILYKKVNLPVEKLVIEGVIKNLAEKTPLIGAKGWEDESSYAFNRYLDVINTNINGKYYLCDIKVRLEQINICLKTGLVFNINGLINRRNKDFKNELSNEIILNFGAYFNFQRFKVSLSLNDNYVNYTDEEKAHYNTPTRTVSLLGDALFDVFNNLGLYEISDEHYNLKISKMLAYLLKKLTNRNLVPKNTKLLGYANNIFNDIDIPEQCITQIFNCFKVRYLVELAYRFTYKGFSFLIGCEVILNSPLNINGTKKKYIEDLKKGGYDVPEEVSKFKLPIDIELLPHISIGKVFSFL